MQQLVKAFHGRNSVGVIIAKLCMNGDSKVAVGFHICNLSLCVTRDENLSGKSHLMI